MSNLDFFIDTGKRDLPVYLTDARRDFLLSEGEDVVLDIKKFDGSFRRITLRLPAAEIRNTEQREFVRDYFFAEVYNILSSLGGSEITVYAPSADGSLTSIFEELAAAFGIGRSRKERAGYGRSVNVIERMLDSQNAAAPFTVNFMRGRAPKSPEKPKRGEAFAERFAKAFAGIEKKLLCGVDIGGTDIKLAVSVNGKLCFLKEYDWFPTLFTRVDRLIEPVRLLVRLLRARVSCEFTRVDAAVVQALDEAVDKHLSDFDMERAVARAEKALGAGIRGFDAIGLCFPDVVIKDKIVGGEVHKTRGIRENPDIDYEAEFKRLMNLNEILSEFCVPGGKAGITNDGPMAAFTAAMEMLAEGRGKELKNGRFAHTMGTDLGTGWIDETGKIPEIPLEAYNFIIDLGSRKAREYHPDDLRSINNFNTRLPGTVQKFMGQNGVFRLAIKTSQAGDGKLYGELLEKGFIREENGGVFVVLKPKDMRKPLLEHLTGLCKAGDPLMREVFLEIGRAAGITFCETEHILAPRTKERVLYGRLVKAPRCFELIKSGAAEIDKSFIISAADEQNAFTPLMLQLKAHPVYTVAQFAQSVGALYYGNYSTGVE